MRVGPLQQHVLKIGSLPLVTPNIPKPLMKKYFNPRIKALYFTLCKIFIMDDQDYIKGSIVLIIAQTLQFGMSSILYFASFLAKEIHNGLIGIAQGEVNRPFFWHSC